MSYPFAGLAVTAAARAQQAAAYGRAVGLTDEQGQEVVAVWREYYRARPIALEWADVERAMAARAMGEQWRPATALEGWMIVRILKAWGLW